MHLFIRPRARRVSTASILRAASVATLAFALCVPVLGCKKMREKIQEKALEKAGVEKVEGDDAEHQNFTFKGKDGKTFTVGTAQKLPDGFPTDVPIYPDAKVFASAGGAGQGDATFSVTLSTEDAPDQVVAFYKSKIPAGGETMSMGNMFAYDDGNKHAITVMVNENQPDAPGLGKTVIQLTVGPASEGHAKTGAVPKAAKK